MEYQDQPTLTSPHAIGPDAPTISVQIGPMAIGGPWRSPRPLERCTF